MSSHAAHSRQTYESVMCIRQASSMLTLAVQKPRIKAELSQCFSHDACDETQRKKLLQRPELN